jgi:hypothetical protein
VGERCHESSQPKHATSLIADRATQFFKCVVIDTYVDCGALREEVHKQNALWGPGCASVPTTLH